MAKSGGEVHHFKGIKVVREGRNAKIHGEIEGFPVGSSWRSRVECSQAGVHAPLRAGIHGTTTDGAYSIVLSGGYEDDEDNGELITYTGQGGRDTKGTLMHQLQGKTLWEGVQNADQEWVLGNKALKISCTTKKPVRVVRGYTLNSLYAPTEGYRYDGLYVVDDAWRAVGKTGFHTCRFTFRRLPNQSPIPGTQPSTQKIVQKSVTKLEPEVEGPAPRVEPSMFRPLSSMSLQHKPTQPVSNVTLNTIKKVLHKPSIPYTPTRPLSCPMSLGSASFRLNAVGGVVRKSANKCSVPPTSLPSHMQANTPRSTLSAVSTFSQPIKQDERDDYTLTSTDSISRTSAVVPLQMVQVQQSLKRPRGERVNKDEGRVPIKRHHVSPLHEPTPQIPRRIVTPKRANNPYARLKFNKIKMEN